MAKLVIDIGNTLTKVAVFKQDEMLHAGQYPATDEKTLLDLIDKYNVDEAIISSVKKETEDWREAMGERIILKYFNAEMATGINILYKTPETLGVDRLAAVIGAHKLYSGKGNLVISGGTAITYDWVDAGGNYFGGSISPGLNMRYKALNYYTGALPLITADDEFGESFGDNTTTAIQSGVQNGIKYELTGFIQSYYNKSPELNIILSGGDSIFFDTLLKNSIFAPYVKNEPYLVLKGLNAVIQNNND
jgi:type III pantothenate kinase